MSRYVGNPEDRFSRNTAQMMPKKNRVANMDGWIQLPKERDNDVYLWEENNSPCSISTQENI